MLIAIDLRIYGPKYGGLGRYNQQLLDQLIKLDSKNQYVLLFREKQNIGLPENFSSKIVDCRWYTIKEQFVLPKILNKIKPDLVHFPHFNVPIFYKGKFIVTIHDLIMTKFPSKRATTLNKLFFFIKYWFYKKVISQAIKNATQIIAVSKFTSKDIKEYFNLNDQEAKKINVVYEGLTITNSDKPASFALPKNYFLYVGNSYPHKNLEFLIKTFAEFIEKHPEYYLVLVGNKNYFYQRLEKENKSKNIIFAGFVSDEQINDYYKRATAYIFPSLYEGFGLPALEAMAQNTPVISSNSSCLPEILGQSALYFDPNDQKDLLDKMEKLVNTPDLVNILKKNGYIQSQKYSWDTMGAEILSIYNRQK